MTPLVALAWLAGCTPAPEPILVLAPTGTRVPLARLATDWGTSRGHIVEVVFGESGALAQMVDGGTAADLLFGFDAARLDDLVARGHLVADTRGPVVGDGLTVVVGTARRDPPADLHQLAADADLRPILTPPTGSATRRAIEAVLAVNGMEEALAGALAATPAGTTPLTEVRAGRAPVGIVTAGEARGAVGVEEAFRLTLPQAPPLVLEGALVAHARSPEPARALLSYLRSEEAKAPFLQRGFVRPDGTGGVPSPPAPHAGPRPAEPGPGPATPALPGPPPAPHPPGHPGTVRPPGPAAPAPGPAGRGPPPQPAK